jgi:thioredoxin-like negative regulator of GroEL
MNSAFKPLLVILVVGVALGLLLAAPRLMERKEVVAWNTDVAGARAAARSAGKPVLLYFTAEWCQPCQHMKHTVFADPEVDATLRAAYPTVKVDIDHNRDVAQEFGVDMIPTFIVVAADGHVVKQETGGMDAQQFLDWVKSPAPPSAPPSAPPATQTSH